MREKAKLIQLRVSDIQRAVIHANAKREGKTVTAFILSRALPAETKPAAVEVAPSPQPAAAPSMLTDKLADLKARFNLKTAAQVEESGPATPPERQPVPKAALRRAFNGHRPQWYNHLGSGDWWELSQDAMTGQVWLVAAGVAREFPTQEAAKAFIDSRE